ncbi:hypothetical protein AAH978_01370 [Streptomyces sp. ZYX-F-203]
MSDARRGGGWASSRLIRAGSATAAALAWVVLSGPTQIAAADEPGYTFADDAVPAPTPPDVTEPAGLELGLTYTGALPRDERVSFELALDDRSDTYVSVTAVPGEADEVTAADGIRVSLEDAEGRSCSLDSTTFGLARSARPITAWGLREISPDENRCQAAGAYRVTVERTRPQDSPATTWALELTTVAEPPLADTATPGPPRTGDPASPDPVAGEPVNTRGGHGFDDATPLDEGVWRDGIRPGETLFYRVPVDWGQRVHAIAELGAAESGRGYTPGALDLTLHNPVRGPIDDAGTAYAGRATTVAPSPGPPVAHGNRDAVAESVSALRFAGDHYLVVHLAGRVADGFGEEALPLTLRVRVDGAPETAPRYAGEPTPGGAFGLTRRSGALDSGRTDHTEGAPAPGGDGDRSMPVLAATGIGTGSLILLTLGCWTVVAQMRARAQKPTP